MRGTLALWYEPHRPIAPAALDAHEGAEFEKDLAPKVELHFNLWRDLSSWTNSLDVGFLLSDVANVKRIYFYIPGVIQQSQIRDLAPVLRVGPTLNAVFNEVVTLGAETDQSYEIRLREDTTICVLLLDRDAIVVEAFKESETTLGSRVVFTEKFCDVMRSSSQPKKYIRFRIELVGPSADLFSSEMTPRDRFFASAISRLELTEFRFNERRSYPARILELAERHNFEITAVHYFLIRDLQHQLLVQHAPFRKVRRLERELWADYLAGNTSPRRFKLGVKLASRLVIYHWKADADRKPIDGFIAFSSFRSSTASLTVYAIVIVLLGAMGSAAQTMSSSYLTSHLPRFVQFPKVCYQALGCPALINLVLIGLLTLALLGCTVGVASAAKCRRAIVTWAYPLFASMRTR